MARPAIALLCLLPLLLPSCANAYRSTVHEHRAVGLRWLAADALQTDRVDPRRVDQRLQGVHAEGYALTFESWLDAGSSARMELGWRSYPTEAVDARAFEFRAGGREYFFEDSRTQPFVEGAMLLAALDIDPAEGLDWGYGGAVGGGVSHFLSNAVALDLSAVFDLLVVDPRTVETAKGDRFRSDENLYGWEFAVQLAFLF